MLHRAFWVHGRRLGTALALLTSFALLVWLGIRQLERQPKAVVLNPMALPEDRCDAVMALSLNNAEDFEVFSKIAGAPETLRGMAGKLFERENNRSRRRDPPV